MCAGMSVDRVSTILYMAGIDETRCSAAELSKARGWNTTPTPEERQEALARLRSAERQEASQ